MRNADIPNWLKMAFLVLVVTGCGGELRPEPPLTRDFNVEPSWSPSDSILVYTHLDYSKRPDSLYQVAVVNLKTMRSAFVATGMTPAFSKDGQSICFVRRGDIYIKSLATGSERQLTFGGEASYPAWSLDGTRIAYARLSTYADSSGIWIADAGSGRTDKLRGVTATMPAWTPRASQLAVITYRMGSPPYEELGIIDLRDTSEHAITQNNLFDRNPTWSPDTTVVLWDGVGSSTTTGVYAMSVMNGTSRLLIDGGSDPCVSPDGARIVYVAYGTVTGGNTLWMANADGSNRRELQLH